MAAALTEDGPIDMKHAVREEVLGAIRQAGAVSKGWMVAVLDKQSTRVISTVLTMYDIMEERVTLVESLEKKRQPFPEMDVIYFVAPSTEAVSKLAEDFKGQATYGNVHIFFLSKVDSSAMSVLQASPKLVSRIKTFKEINVDFLVADPFVFHMDVPPAVAYADLYRDSTTAFVQLVASKLLTVCAALHECPVVRCRPDSPMEMVGLRLVGMLAELKATGAWWHYGMAGHTERPQGVMLLLDRSEDMVTPALHMCTYQCLVNDLLEAKENVVTVEVKGKPQEVLLSQKDELWVQFKHQHIADVIDGLAAFLKALQERGGGLEKIKEGTQSVQEVAAAMKKLPEYQAQVANYSQHQQLAQRCTRELQARDSRLLNMITDIEQNLATGYDQVGGAVKLPEVLDAMLDVLMVDDVSLKLRLALLLVATQRDKLKPADLDRVCTAAGLAEEDRAVVAALQSLTACPPPAASSEPAVKKKTGWSLSKMMRPTAAAASGPEPFVYPSSRYNTPLKAIATELATDKLSHADFPMVPGQDAPAAAAPQSMRRTPGWASKKQSFAGGRNFIFMAGGVTYAEMKDAAEVSAATNKEVILGGTSILTPANFLEGLRGIS